MLTPGACFNKNKPEIAAKECRKYFAGGYPAHPAPARLPGSELETDADAEELFDEAMARLGLGFGLGFGVGFGLGFGLG